MENPYRPSRGVPSDSPPHTVVGSPYSLAAYKWILALLGIALYCSTPWRDKRFFYAIANNEGFGTTDDSVAVGIAGSVIATGFLFPVAVALIGIGVGRCTRIQVLPRFDRFTVAWGVFATIVFVGMLVIETGYVAYAVRYSHHLSTSATSLVYIGFMYLWWCCSLCHGRPGAEGEPSDAPESPSRAF